MLINIVEGQYTLKFLSFFFFFQLNSESEVIPVMTEVQVGTQLGTVCCNEL